MGRGRPGSSRHLLPLILLGALLAAWPLALQAQGNPPPSPNSVIGLAVSPADPAQILAGTLNAPQVAGIYRSTDAGLTWADTNAPLPPNTAIAAILFDPQDPARVLAVDGGVGRLFLSTDGGQTWREEPSLQQALSPNSAVGRLFARVEGDTTVIYAGSRWDGVLRTQDGGRTWEKLAEGLQDQGVRVRALAAKDGILYAGTHNGLYRLLPDTLTWQQITTFPTRTIVRGLTVWQGLLYAGTFDGRVLFSPDGVTWSQDTSFPGGMAIYDLATAGYRLVAATSNGLWGRLDGDWSHDPVDGQPYAAGVYKLAAASSLPGVIYAGTEQDWVLRSDDGGRTWSSYRTLSPLIPEQVPGPPTPTPTATPTPTDTPTPTATPTATATPTPTPSLVEQAAREVVQLPPSWLAAMTVLLVVVLMAGLAVVRGPEE